VHSLVERPPHPPRDLQPVALQLAVAIQRIDDVRGNPYRVEPMIDNKQASQGAHGLFADHAAVPHPLRPGATAEAHDRSHPLSEGEPAISVVGLSIPALPHRPSGDPLFEERPMHILEAALVSNLFAAPVLRPTPVRCRPAPGILRRLLPAAAAIAPLLALLPLA
jgi:hypothetical protein